MRKEVFCPECGCKAFPTNFRPEHFGGKKNDDRAVWFCSDMGHCAFTLEEGEEKMIEYDNKHAEMDIECD